MGINKQGPFVRLCKINMERFSLQHSRNVEALAVFNAQLERDHGIKHLSTKLDCAIAASIAIRRTSSCHCYSSNMEAEECQSRI